MEVISTGLDVLVQRLDKRPKRVWLASPFIGRDVGLMLAEDLAELVEAELLDNVRVLTCLTEAGLRSGYTHPEAVRAFVRALPNGSVRTLANLHAKVCLVDGWALVGSGNLSASGVDGQNAELGLAGTDAAVVQEVEERFELWWAHAVVVRPEHLRGRRAITERAQRHRTGPRLPSRRFPAESGLALARWKRDQAAMALRRVLAADVQPRRDGRKRLPRGRSAAYRACRQLRDEDPRTRKLLREVLAGHPMVDARVHAAWRLSQETSGREIEPATIRALVWSYGQDPALVVRRNAYRALVRLRAAGRIVVDGPLHEPRSLDVPVTVGRVRRTSPA